MKPLLLVLVAGVLAAPAAASAAWSEPTTTGTAPNVVFAPGHTLGHCALHLPDRDVLLAGDALVTLDPYTGRRGPRLVARAATADAERNLRSLDALAETGATNVFTGHGEPWRQGIEAAVQRARAEGSA